MKADCSDPVNTGQYLFKIRSNEQHFFIGSTEQAMVLLKKYELETATRLSWRKLHNSECLDEFLPEFIIYKTYTHSNCK